MTREFLARSRNDVVTRQLEVNDDFISSRFSLFAENGEHYDIGFLGHIDNLDEAEVVEYLQALYVIGHIAMMLADDTRIAYENAIGIEDALIGELGL